MAKMHKMLIIYEWYGKCFQNGIKHFCKPNRAYNQLQGWVHQLNIQIQDYREGHRKDRAKMLNMSGMENVFKMVINTSLTQQSL